MTVTLQVWDEAQSAILFDLNDPTGANSGLYGSIKCEVVGDVDLGSPKLESSTVEAQDIDATYSSFSKRAAAPMRFKLLFKGTSYDNLTLGLATLAQFLTQGCVMKFSAGSAVYFLDILPSDTPALLSGQEDALMRTVSLNHITVDVQLKRQPYLRGSGLSAATNILANATLLRDSNADGLPDSWTKDGASTLTIPAASQSLHAILSGVGVGVVQQTGAASQSVGQVWTLSGEVKLTSGLAVLNIQWFNAASGFISANASTATSSSTWTRISITATAPAATDHAIVGVAASVGAATVDARNIQFELASSASAFRVKSQTVNLDPATTGFSKMLPVYNPGTAPAPMTITTAFPDASSNVESMDYFLATTDGIPGNHYLSDYLNGPYYAQAEANGNGWTLTAGTDTTLAGAVDATASPGSGT